MLKCHVEDPFALQNKILWIKQQKPMFPLFSTISQFNIQCTKSLNCSVHGFNLLYDVDVKSGLTLPLTVDSTLYDMDVKSGLTLPLTVDSTYYPIWM